MLVLKNQLNSSQMYNNLRIQQKKFRLMTKNNFQKFKQKVLFHLMQHQERMLSNRIKRRRRKRKRKFQTQMSLSKDKPKQRNKNVNYMRLRRNIGNYKQKKKDIRIMKYNSNRLMRQMRSMNMIQRKCQKNKLAKAIIQDLSIIKLKIKQ